MASTGNPLDLYEPLDIIGNGSFGIIRKVRRKSDGQILARKELNFEKMSDRDRKQIVAEVNILKDLHHENIVRYHDRFVDRDAGILYILMEYCDGGDLSSVIKQATRSNRPLPEDTVWAYFYQLLLALQHCHSPNSPKPNENGVVEPKRQQILHRDLKPENVFLSGAITVKLGDFGLSKALGNHTFASTYVGTPYYMSPELIQEKTYDAKSDIWSLGCLIYELCALKPPFHEAQTHSELSMLIRSGRIPPIPKGYSVQMVQVIKAMLNLNPAMRPSAAQLLQHERIEFARKVSDTERMLVSIKTHKANLQTKERDLQNLAATLAQRENLIATTVAQKDAEIQRLALLTTQADLRIKEAVAAREEELRIAVMQREEEVRTAMARREQEILDAVRRREEEINVAWKQREEQLRNELSEAVQWVESRQKELTEEAERLTDEAQKLDKARADLEKEVEKAQSQKGRKEKKPLEEVKNLLAPLTRLAHHEAKIYDATPRKPVSFASSITPAASRVHFLDTPGVPGSAMRGIVMTATGEVLKTPAPLRNPVEGDGAALSKIIMESPQVGLNFRKIFDFESETEDEDEDHEEVAEDGTVADEDEDDKQLMTSGASSSSASSSGSSSGQTDHDFVSREAFAPLDPNTPSKPLLEKVRLRSSKSSSTKGRSSQSRARSLASAPESASKTQQPPPTRIRKPSIRLSAGRPGLPKSNSLPANLIGETPNSQTQPQPHRQATAPPVPKVPVPPTPRYDPSDEENLPSPFLKRADRERYAAAPAVAGTKKAVNAGVVTAIGSRRKSNSNILRAIAAANSAANHSPASAATLKTT